MRVTLALLASLALSLAAHAQSTAFTYEGRLNEANTPATGTYEMRFMLFSAATNGLPASKPILVAPVAVSNGLFTVVLDFGPNTFDGTPLWLEISVASLGSDDLITLSPRQPVMPTPYAMFALESATTRNVRNPAFLGTTDNASLEFYVNNRRALRLEPTAEDIDHSGIVNVIGGSEGNFVLPGVYGATIAGGGATNYFEGFAVNVVSGDFGTVGGGSDNTSAGEGATIAGGFRNMASGSSATIGGGVRNASTAESATVGGGFFNVSSANGATISGGQGNVSRGPFATVGGGENNQSEGRGSVVPGGSINLATGDNSFAAGQQAQALHHGAFVWSDNAIGPFASTTTNQFAVRATGGARFETAGAGMTLDGPLEVWLKGSRAYTVAPGSFDSVNIIGGSGHNLEGGNWYITIGGGSGHIVESNVSYATIGGGAAHNIAPAAHYAVIDGGEENRIYSGADYSAVGGGSLNIIYEEARWAVIAGGIANEAWGENSTVAGGFGNTVEAGSSTIGGGVANYIQTGNPATNNLYATIPGGRFNYASGPYTFAAGHQARAVHPGAFVWADSTDAPFPSTATNQLSVRASGGVRLETAGAGLTLDGQPILSGPVASSHIADGSIVDDDISAAAQIEDTKLGPITAPGKVANSATSATSVNAPGTIVGRDPSGDFSAGTITAIFAGNGSALTALNASRLDAGTVPDARLAPNIARTNQVWLVAPSGSGSQALGTTDNTSLELKANNQRGLRLEPTARIDTISVIAGSARNFVGSGAVGVTISGGGSGNYEGGAFTNSAHADFATISGGLGNTIHPGATRSTIAGGWLNEVGTNCSFGVIGGGWANRLASGAEFSVISAGFGNTVGTNSGYSVIAGGERNSIGSNSLYAAIPGGIRNYAIQQAFAAGSGAKANHRGAFVWGDAGSVDTISTNANSVTMRAAGGYRLFTSTIGAGVYLASGSSTWTTVSDRNAKENFEAVNARAVLDKVAALPVSTWNYKAQTNSIRHIGPTAQDFKAAFDVGESDTGITTVDADGVALAAIQGLNQKLDEQLRAKDAEIRTLRNELAELKRLVSTLAKE